MCSCCSSVKSVLVFFCPTRSIRDWWYKHDLSARQCGGGELICCDGEIFPLTCTVYTAYFQTPLTPLDGGLTSNQNLDDVKLTRKQGREMKNKRVRRFAMSTNVYLCFC